MIANLKPKPAATDISKLLVVDDSPIIQRAVYFLLRDRGFQVLMSGDLTEAMNLIRSEQPDIILLDISFPDEETILGDTRDGFWAMNRLNQLVETRDIPVVMLSSADPTKTEPLALAAGAAAFLPKPLDMGRLLKLIQKLTAVKRAPALQGHSLKMAA